MCSTSAYVTDEVDVTSCLSLTTHGTAGCMCWCSHAERELWGGATTLPAARTSTCISAWRTEAAPHLWLLLTCWPRPRDRRTQASAMGRQLVGGNRHHRPLAPFPTGLTGHRGLGQPAAQAGSIPSS